MCKRAVREMKAHVLLIGLLLAAVAPLSSSAQDAGSVIDTAAKTMGTATLQSIRYTGSGTNNSVGQAFTSGGPWPRFKVTKYVALVNYTAPAMRQESFELITSILRVAAALDHLTLLQARVAFVRSQATLSRTRTRMDARNPDP